MYHDGRLQPSLAFAVEPAAVVEGLAIVAAVVAVGVAVVEVIGATAVGVAAVVGAAVEHTRVPGRFD